MRRARRCTLWLQAGVAVLALLGLAVDRSGVVAWVGSYPVQVKTERGSLRPVREASVALLFRGEWAATDGDSERTDSGWTPVAVNDGGSFTVQVKHGGKESGLRRAISYGRQEVLVVRVAYTDGGRELVVAALPECYSRRELFLRVP